MDDPQNISGSVPPDKPVEGVEQGELGAGHESVPPAEFGSDSIPGQPIELLNVAITTPRPAASNERSYADAAEEVALRRRSFRHNLFLLLSLVLSAFILTSWILVRVDAPFGIFSTGPQEVVRAQL